MHDHMPGISGLENAARTQEHSWSRLVRAWLRFSGPARERFSSSLEDQERLRRSRVLSALFPLILVAILVIIPTAIPVPTYWISIATLFGLGLVAFVCNRAALINLSGLFLVFAIDATITVLMITLPTGIRNSNIPDFDLLLLATLVGGIVLPRRVLLFLALFHMLLIIALFTFLPHDPLLTREIQVNQGGFAYSELSDALLLQMIGTALAWLNARSVDFALARASKAEDLAEAQRVLNEQARLQVEQKERLEYGIEILKEAHARFANGDYRARAVLHDNELASLAASFNLLADRLNRIARTAQDQSSLEMAFQQLFAIQEEVVYGGPLRPLPPTGTLVDRVYPWLKQYYLFRQAYNRCGAVIEKARFALTRQKAALVELIAVLDQIRGQMRLDNSSPQMHATTLDLLAQAQSLCRQIEEQGKTGLQEAKQLDQMLKI